MAKFKITFAESGNLKIIFNESNNLKADFGQIYEVERNVETYTGAYTVTPKAHTDTVLPTNNKKCLDDITVSKVPFYRTSNIFGDTIYIADEV